MANSNKNRLEIRLDPESQALLDSLVVRTSLTKTSIIKNALKVYASTLKNGHIYTVKLKGSKEEPEITGINDEKDEEPQMSYDEIMEELKKTEKKDDENDIIEYLKRS